jgi:2-keto-4-pentenoate hydratase/2-oxohepta-3-ene-1,7-dioic acid hydratase in catechol pathway
VIGADGVIGGRTLMNDWVAPGLAGAKAHDFAISLGPVVVTDMVEDLGDLVARAARNTRLLPGDVIAAPGEPQDAVGAGDIVELTLPPFGTLRNAVAA